jgi:hypothetical protein
MRLAVYLLPVVWLAVYLLPADAAGSVPVARVAGSVPDSQLMRLAVYLLPADAGGSIPVAS